VSARKERGEATTDTDVLGEESQICLLGACLLITYVPCSEQYD
jgi:hypothetical protein